jgi:hypothetical protein
MRGAHLREDFIQPLQRAVEVHFDPAGGRRDVLPVVFCAPALHEAHADGAHLGELVHRLEAVVHRLAEQLGELAVVEDLERAAGRDLAHGGRVEVVVVVALARLHEDAAVAEALGKHLPANVVQMHTWNHNHTFYSQAIITVSFYTCNTLFTHNPSYQLVTTFDHQTPF